LIYYRRDEKTISAFILIKPKKFTEEASVEENKGEE
jgi:hypothetical protein